jgi:hypothetical protein
VPAPLQVGAIPTCRVGSGWASMHVASLCPSVPKLLAPIPRPLLGKPGAALARRPHRAQGPFGVRCAVAARPPRSRGLLPLGGRSEPTLRSSLGWSWELVAPSPGPCHPPWPPRQAVPRTPPIWGGPARRLCKAILNGGAGWGVVVVPPCPLIFT